MITRKYKLYKYKNPHHHRHQTTGNVMQMYTRCQPGLINKHTPLKCYVALTLVCLFHHYSEPKLGSKNIEKLAKSNTKSFVKTTVRAVVIEQRLVIKTIGMYDHGMSFDYNQDDNQRSLSTKGKELNSTSFTRSGKPNDSENTKNTDHPQDMYW